MSLYAIDECPNFRQHHCGSSSVEHLSFFLTFNIRHPEPLLISFDDHTIILLRRSKPLTTTMAPLTKAATPALRAWTRHALPTVRPSAASLAFPRATTATQSRNASGGTDVSPNASAFDDPFRRSGGTAQDTHKVPSFGKYKSSATEAANKTFSYFMVGTFGAITALGAKATVQGESPSIGAVHMLSRKAARKADPDDKICTAAWYNY